MSPLTFLLVIAPVGLSSCAFFQLDKTRIPMCQSQDIPKTYAKFKACKLGQVVIEVFGTACRIGRIYLAVG